MPIETYYLSRTKEGKFGSVFVLKQLQEAAASGGGSNLLGSMVQWISGSFTTDYPIPQCMAGPRALIKELDKRKVELGIDGESTLKIQVAGSKEQVKIERKSVFGLGIGPFPVIPFNFALDLDFSKLKTITLEFGAGTYSEYIPMAYLAGLYQMLGGKPTVALGGKLLEENAFVNQIVNAKNYSVAFESTDSFSAGIDAKLKQFNALPEIGGKVKIQKTTERKLVAEVKSDTYYTVALTAARWKNLK